MLEARDTRGRLAQLIDKQLQLQKELTEEERKSAESRSIVGRLAAEERVAEILGEQKTIQEERNAIQAEFNRLIGEGLGITEATNKAIKGARGRDEQSGGEGGESTAGILPGADADAAFQQYQVLEKLAEQHLLNLYNKERKYDALGLAFKKATGKQKVGLLLKEGAAMTAGAAQSNRKLFELNKAFAIADAVVSVSQGVAAGLKLGWPASVPAVAYALGTGLPQIAAIKNTQFGGGGGVGTTPSAAGTVPTINSTPISSADDDFITDRTTQPTNVISIDFSGGITDTNAVREFIENDFAEALRDGSGLDVQVVAV